MPADRNTVLSKSKESRKNSKPAMERRRRQRINQSLSDLKTIILNSMKASECPRHASKLEKADILELTVRHLQALHRNLGSKNPGDFDGYRTGYSHCAEEACRFLTQTDQCDPKTVQTLAVHLSQSVLHISQPQDQTLPPPADYFRKPVPSKRPTESQPSPNNVPQFSNLAFKVTPTRSISGDVVFVLNRQLPVGAREGSLSPTPMKDGYESKGQFFGKPLDYSFSGTPSSQSFRSSYSPDSSHSHSSDCENVWRPW